MSTYDAVQDLSACSLGFVLEDVEEVSDNGQYEDHANKGTRSRKYYPPIILTAFPEWKCAMMGLNHVMELKKSLHLQIVF